MQCGHPQLSTVATGQGDGAAADGVGVIRKLGDISGHGVLKQLVGRASGFHDQLVNLCLQVGGENSLPCLQDNGKVAFGKAG
jgi:hypothetical protein